MDEIRFGPRPPTEKELAERAAKQSELILRSARKETTWCTLCGARFTDADTDGGDFAKIVLEWWEECHKQGHASSWDAGELKKRLRAATPPRPSKDVTVTDEAVERATHAWFDNPTMDIRKRLRKCLKAALTAALTKQPQEGEKG
jgi:hypothetical protein